MQPASSAARGRGVPTMVLAAWVIAVVAGYLAMANYAARPGSSGEPPAVWPAGSSIVRGAEHGTLLMFIHPACPCTSATLAELARLASHAGERLAIHALFVRPPGAAAGWEHTAHWSRAAEIPAVRCATDVDGVEARRFGAATSGHVMLYDASGRLVFHGGITPSRGHEGDNVGKTAILRWLAGRPGEATQTPVFGCPLLGDDEACAVEGSECSQ